MDRRDLAIILIFLMLAVGGGLPQALHWKVDHGCCGSAGCAAAIALEPEPSFSCSCPHHRDDEHVQYDHSGDTGDPEAETELVGATAAHDERTGAVEDDPGDPLSDHHDCSICQFLATLAAVVTTAVETPVSVQPIQWLIRTPSSAVRSTARITSQGPRAPPHIA